MPSLGERLRRAREQQGRSLSEMAKETCITSRYLAAIEANDPKPVPGEFFYRNYVKQYAKALSLDPDVCAREADVILPHNEVEPLAGTPLPTVQRSAPAPAASHGYWRLMALAAACCLAFAAVLIVAINASQRLIESRRQPVDAAPVQETESQNSPATVQEPASHIPDSQTTVSVKVAANEPAWVSVSSEGKTLFRGRIEADETKDFTGVENAKLWTRNAAALNVEWNGKTIGPLGSRGQVALVLFTPETYRIVEPHGL